MKDSGNLTILDLINKIAYNEEMPSRIKVFGSEWVWTDEFSDYEILRDSDLEKFESSFLFKHIFESAEYENKYSLNEIVYLLDNEIEDKKIEKIDLRGYYDKDFQDEAEWLTGEETIVIKINELIDEVNKLKEVTNE